MIVGATGRRTRRLADRKSRPGRVARRQPASNSAISSRAVLSRWSRAAHLIWSSTVASVLEGGERAGRGDGVGLAMRADRVEQVVVGRRRAQQREREIADAMALLAGAADAP